MPARPGGGRCSRHHRRVRAARQLPAGAGHVGRRSLWPRGSGYVVESLEAALWCFGRNPDFRSSILAAANLGEDADTTAAVCGQIAGAFYGEEGIPAEWRTRVAMRDQILALADQLYEAQ